MSKSLDLCQMVQWHYYKFQIWLDGEGKAFYVFLLDFVSFEEQEG